MYAEENYFVMIFLVLQRGPLVWMFLSRRFAALDNKRKQMGSVPRPDISHTINTTQAKVMFWLALKLMEVAMSSSLFLSVVPVVQ
jgi:hypothetical protein